MGVGSTRVRFAIITDSHQNYADLRATIKHINNSNVQFVIHMGDFTNSGTRDEYNLFFKYIKSLNAPLYVIPGNHDLTTVGRKLYARAFGAENNAITGNFGKLIFWNNNKLESGQIDFNFLKNEITSADPAMPVFLFQHQHPYNDLSFTSADSVFYTQTLKSHARPIVFYGHLHNFYVETIDGIPFTQISRVEGENWGLVEIEAGDVKVHFCQKYSCTLVRTL